MEYFSSITVTYSIILGLGIANMLTSMVAMFRSRGHGRLHWMPLLWAGCIFILQIQFWWAVIELRNMETWAFSQFLVLMVVALLLFLSAALVIPDNVLGEGQNLIDEFHRDGQWSLGILSLYAIVAAMADIIFWDMRIISAEMAFLAAEAVLPLITLMTRRSWLEKLITVMYALTCFTATFHLSPGRYS